MRASRLSVLTVASLVGVPVLAAAQTSPPPAESTPPASAAPSYPPPPGQPAPPGNQPAPPAPQPPPPGYQQPPPGYQQPPAGYQQPPPGYQQPPAGYQAPPPGYPPPGYQGPPGYYQAPPGYYQPPPPGYYPPPGYAYRPPPPGGYPPPAPRPPPRTHGFLALPYIGTESHTGSSGAAYNPGFIIGALIGGRLNPAFSLNGELRADILSLKGVPQNEKWEASEFDFAFSPLFHVQFPAGEFVVGPKLGIFGYEERDSINGTETHKQTWSGVTYGVNAGVFLAVSRIMSLGGMLSYTVRDPSQVCDTDETVAFPMEHCVSDNYQAENVLGFHAAMLF